MLTLVVFVAAIASFITIVRIIKNKFERWESEIKGKYSEIDIAKTAISSTKDTERENYKKRVTELETQIKGINVSLQSISSEAVAQVKSMSSAIQPVISMFRTPQTAGIEYAEVELEILLKTHLGDGLYERKPRHLASGNETVDFIIKLPDCLIPIDSKFPEAVYRAWVEATEAEAKAKWRVFRDAVIKQLENTSKYIRPEAGTTDYALLFLPSDVIWQQAFLVNKWYGEENTVLKRSQEVMVFGCSAQTLMPYLGLLRLGLRNLKIAEDVKAVQRQIDQLTPSLGRFNKDWETLKKHIDDAANVTSAVEGPKGSLAALQKTIENLTKHGEKAAELLPSHDGNKLEGILEVQKEVSSS